MSKRISLFGRKKGKSLTIKALSLFIFPCVVLLSVIFMFFLSDSFWIYAKLLLWDNISHSEVSWDMDGNTFDFMGLPGGSGSTSTGSNPYNIRRGEQLILISKMAGGFCKDYLEIVRDHCNWTYMSSNAMTRIVRDEEGKAVRDASGNIVYERYKIGGKVWSPTVDSVIGFHLCESAVYKLGDIYVPYTTVVADRYNEVDGYNLYNVTSKWIAEHGYSYLHSEYYSDPSMLRLGKYYHTHLQFTQNFFSWYPAGQFLTLNESSASDMYIIRNTVPSTLKTGYGISQSEERTWKDRDAAYFPDQISIVLQSSCGRLLANCDTEEVNPNTLGYVAYYGHHLGGSTYDLGRGQVYDTDTLPDESPNDAKACMASAVKDIEAIILKAQEYFRLDGEVAEFNYNEYTSYWGLGGSLLLTLRGGFFRTTEHQQKFLSYLEDENSDFAQGALLGYRLGTDNTNATIANLRTFVQSTQVLKTSLTGYPPVHANQDRTASGDEGFVIYTLDSTCPVLYPGSSTAVPVLHAFRRIDLRGFLRAAINGPYTYWKMLNYAGVECSLQDAYADLTGQYIERIPETETIYNTAVVTTDNTILARRAVQFALKTKGEGENSRGSELYVFLHDTIFPGDIYCRSCDRTVATAVRWSGKDIDFCIGGCYNQTDYMSSSPKWERVEWDGDVSKLKPGDILIRSDMWMQEKGITPPTKHQTGHVVMYVGNEIIKERWNDVSDYQCIVHGSYGDRGPHIAAFYSELKTFWVFRCVNQEVDTKWNSLDINGYSPDRGVPKNGKY